MLFEIDVLKNFADLIEKRLLASSVCCNCGYLFCKLITLARYFVNDVMLE